MPLVVQLKSNKTVSYNGNNPPIPTLHSPNAQLCQSGVPPRRSYAKGSTHLRCKVYLGEQTWAGGW